MVKVNRDGFTRLSGSEKARNNQFLLKYNLASTFFKAILLILDNIIFVHGLGGNP
jgi:hypothetical protein